MFENYLVEGLFTTQEQIENASEYNTGNSILDELKLGSLKLADINGDDVIDAGDKIESGDLRVDNRLANTVNNLVSASFGQQPEE